MKKTFLFILIVIFATNLANAQNTDRTRIGVRGGVSFTNMSKDKKVNVDKTNMLTTFNAAILIDVPIIHHIFYFQPALGVSGKGVKYDLLKTDQDNLTVKVNPFYGNVQANFVLKLPIADNFKLFVGAGPYAAAGLFGKVKIEGKLAGVEYNKNYDIKFSDDDATGDLEHWARLNRFDYGVNAIAGLEISNLVISANYEYGLAKMQVGKTENDKDFGKNRAFSVSVGFLF